MATTPRKVHGADCSHHNANLDLGQAKGAGLGFFYHKATEGTTVKDDQYGARRAAAAKAKLPFGAYHFARPDGGDAVAEAKAFLAYAKPKPGDLIPALDLEVDGGLSRVSLRNWAIAFSEEVKRQVGVLPVLYSPWDLGLPNIRWVPRYNDSNTPPTVPWDIWQFSNGVYGVPDSFPGLGHVDLNTFRDGFGLNKILMPTPEREEKAKRLRVAHLSGETFDTPEQRLNDYEKILKRGYDVITGTELSDDIVARVRNLAQDLGYRLSWGKRHDTWVAVKADRITKNSWQEGAVHVLDSAPAVGDPHPYSAKGIRWASWFDIELGRRVSVGSVHFLTKGRWRGQAQQDKPGDPVDHYKANTIYAHACGDWAREFGKGSAIAFIAGDTNLLDSRVDVFRGAPLTTIGDELKRYANTGHGDIDVWASYDGDAAVRGVSLRVLDDSEVRFNSDHYLYECVWEIQSTAA